MAGIKIFAEVASDKLKADLANAGKKAKDTSEEINARASQLIKAQTSTMLKSLQEATLTPIQSLSQNIADNINTGLKRGLKNAGKTIDEALKSVNLKDRRILLDVFNQNLSLASYSKNGLTSAQLARAHVKFENLNIPTKQARELVNILKNAKLPNANLNALQDALNLTRQRLKAEEAIEKTESKREQTLRRINAQGAKPKTRPELPSASRTIGTTLGSFASRMALPLITGASIIGGSRAFLSASEEIQTLTNRLELLTGNANSAHATLAKLQSLARTNGASLEATVETFEKLQEIAPSLGLTQDRVLKLTDTINKALRAGGSSATSAKLGLTQFAQALNLGQLRGQDLNSVMSQTPGLARALADGLGVSVAQLKSLANEGKLTSEAIVNALEKASTSARLTKVSTQALSLSASYQGFVDTIKASSATLDHALGFSNYWSEAIQNLTGVLKVATVDLKEFFATVGMSDDMKRKIREAKEAKQQAQARLNAQVNTIVAPRLKLELELKGIGNQLKEEFSDTFARLKELTALKLPTRANINLNDNNQAILKQDFASFKTRVDEVFNKKSAYNMFAGEIQSLQTLQSSILTTSQNFLKLASGTDELTKNQLELLNASNKFKESLNDRLNVTGYLSNLREQEALRSARISAPVANVARQLIGASTSEILEATSLLRRQGTDINTLDLTRAIEILTSARTLKNESLAQEKQNASTRMDELIAKMQESQASSADALSQNIESVNKISSKLEEFLTRLGDEARLKEEATKYLKESATAQEASARAMQDLTNALTSNAQTFARTNLDASRELTSKTLSGAFAQ